MGEQSFDHYDFIIDNVESNMSLFEYNVCSVPIGSNNSDRTRISSIQLIYANEEASEEVELPGAGPDAGSCEYIMLEHREPINFIRVYGGGSFITGIAFIYDYGTPVTLIGQTTQSSYEDFQIEPGNILMGIFGEASDEAITSIGFITQDTVCTEAEQHIEEV